MKTSLKSDDQAVAISLDFILSFTIAVFVFVIIFIALAGYLTSSNEFIMREKFKDIGNEISTKMVNIYNMGGKNGLAYTWVKLPDDINGIPFDVKIVGNGSDGSDPVRIVVAAQRLNAETYVTVNELGDNVYVESNVLTCGNIYTIIYDNLNIYFYQGFFDVNKTPSPYITFPINNTFVKGDLNVLVRSDPDTTLIEFQNSSVLNANWNTFGIDNDKKDGWSRLFSTKNFKDGDYILFRVNATDRIGKNGTSPIVNVTVDNTPPVIIPRSPVNGSKIYSSRPYINASYSDAVSGINVGSVKMYLNGLLIKPSTLNATNVSYRPNYYMKGTYNVTVIVEDNAGNVNSTSWSFEVKTIKKNLRVTGGYDSSSNPSVPRSLTPSKLWSADNVEEKYSVPVGFIIDVLRNHTYYFNQTTLNSTDVIRSVNITFNRYSTRDNITAELHLYHNISGLELGFDSFISMSRGENTSYWDVTPYVTNNSSLSNLRMKLFAFRPETTGKPEIDVDLIDVAYEYYLD